MKNRYIYLAMMNLSRRKITVIINIVIITISLFVILMSSTVSESVDSYLDKYIYSSLNFRTVDIGIFKLQEGQKEKIEKIANREEHIIDFYHENWGASVKIKNTSVSNFFEPYKEKDFFGELSLNTFTKAYEDVILIGDFSEKGATEVGIIPKRFYPSGSFQIGTLKEENEFINGESLIGESITIEYYARDYSKEEMPIIKTFSYTFKVVGVYDILPNMDDPYDVLIPYEDMELINHNLDQYNEGLSEDFCITYSVVVDDYNYVNSVIEILRNNGLSGMPRSEMGSFAKIASYIILSGYILGVIILLVGLVNIALTTLKSIEKRTGEIGLLKAIGYRNSHLLTIVGVEAITIGTMSFMLSTIIYVVLIVVSKQIISNNLSIYMQQFTLEFNVLQVLINGVISIVIPLISSIFGILVVVQISPKNALDEGGDVI